MCLCPEIHPGVISALLWTYPPGVCLCSSVINVHYHYSKCALLLILHIVTFRGASEQVSRRTASALSCPCAGERGLTTSDGKQRKTEKKNVRSPAQFVLSRLPLKKVVFRGGFHPLHGQCWEQRCHLDVKQKNASLLLMSDHLNNSYNPIILHRWRNTEEPKNDS